jgi:DnaJ-class molecular chaperone
MKMTLQKALSVFGYSDIDSLNLQELKKQYLDMAVKRHPDKGGSSEGFIELKDAYAYLKQFVDSMSGNTNSSSSSNNENEKTENQKVYGVNKDYVSQLEYINTRLTDQNEKYKKNLNNYESLFNKQVQIFNHLNEKLTKLANTFNLQSEKNKTTRDKSTEDLKSQYSPAFKDLIAPFQRRIDKEEYIWRLNHITQEFEDKKKELENSFLNSMVEVYQNDFEALAQTLDN